MQRYRYEKVPDGFGVISFHKPSIGFMTNVDCDQLSKAIIVSLALEAGGQKRSIVRLEMKAMFKTVLIEGPKKTKKVETVTEQGRHISIFMEDN